MPPASTTATTPATVETAISLLEALGADLGRAGWVTRLHITPGRAPSLHVQNPAAAQLADTIWAAPKDDGFWFWWSWAEPIAKDPAAAAAIIVRALRTQPET
jgi:hypothetical protein